MEGITLHEHFATLEDPRVERTNRHFCTVWLNSGVPIL
jgi:hypothetical protein